MSASIKISSEIFEIGNQQALDEFFNFVNINPQFVKGSFLFENTEQHNEFQKFRNSFQTIKSLFPNFELKFKKLKNDQKGLSSSVLKQEIKTNDESVIIESSIPESALKEQSLSLLQFNDLQKVHDQINKSVPNQKQQKNKIDKLQDFGEKQYKLNQSLDSSDEDNEDLKQANQLNVQQIPNQAFSSLISEVSSSNENSQTFEQFLESNKNQQDSVDINNSISRLNISLSKIYPIETDNKMNNLTVIEIQGINSKDVIKLKNPLVLPIISSVFLPEWTTLMGNLNLSKQKENLYKQKLQQDVQVQKTQILAFVDSIQQTEISFCYNTFYVMTAESKINEFLKSIEVYTYQNNDEFYLVSRKKSKEYLMEIYQQINKTYRGIFLNFSNIKPYQTQLDLNKDLQKVRHLFHKKFLSEEIKKYSFYQYFNDKYFFFEMNFSKIIENRDAIEKHIKKYVEAFIKDLFMIKFQISANNEIDNQLEDILQKNINQKTLIIIYNQNEFIIFGTPVEIYEYFSLLEQNNAIKDAIKFSMIKLIIDQSNFIYQIKGNKLKIDFIACVEQLERFGFQHKEVQNQSHFILTQSSKFTFENLIQSIKFLCLNRGNNSNYRALAQLNSIFRKSIENKQLTAPLNFLSEFQNTIQEDSSQISINIDINPQLQGFQYKQYIELQPQFLDHVIREICYEEYEKTFNQKNYSLQKIGDGKYQLCSTTKQTLSQFESYFNSFQTEIINLDYDSLLALESSYIYKEELKVQKISFQIQNYQLYLVTQKKNSSQLQQAINKFKNYQGFIFYMVSLGKTNQNERPEYLSLVQARAGHMKIFFKNQILENIICINKLEQREIYEISSFCIIHLDFARSNQQKLQDEEKQEIKQQVIQFLTRKYQIMYYVEIKTKEQNALKLIQQIDRKQVYTTLKQQYQENYIQILGSKTNYLDLYKTVQEAEFNEEGWKDTEIYIYVEQFCLFKNLIQNQDSLQKFKRELEKKGFEVDDTSKIKWILRPKILSQTFQIFQLLAQKMDDDQEFNRIFQPYLSSIIRENKKEISVDNSLELLMQDLNNQSKQAQKEVQGVVDLSQKIPQEVLPPKQTEPKKAPVQQQAPQILPNPQPIKQEEKEHAKTLLPESTLIKIEKQALEKDNFSIDSENPLSNSSISEVQPNSQAPSYSFQDIFKKECLLVEFQTKKKQVEPPPNEILAQFLKKNYSDQEFEYFIPEVDVDYVSYFQSLAQYHTIVYIVQKPDKEYRNEFSRKLLYYLHHDKAIEKFMSHKSLILICFKTNKLAHFWIPTKEKPYQICLKEPNQTLPYLWVRRK